MDSLSPFQQQLVESNVDFVRKIVCQVVRLTGTGQPFDELLSVGMLGLIDSARRYDPSKGFRFSTFAYYRVRGIIFDSLKKTSKAASTSLLRAEERANDYLQEVSRDMEFASSLSMEKALEQLAGDLSSVALCHVLGQMKESEIADPNGLEPHEIMEENEKNAFLRKSIQQLPPEMQAIIRDLYYKDLTLEEFARKRKHTKSWACRLHAKALQELRKCLETQ